MSSVETVEFTWRLSEHLWREGNYRSARAVLRRLEVGRSELSADILIGTSVMLNIIEKRASDYTEALRVLQKTEPLIVACNAPVLKGKWLNSLGVTYMECRDSLSAAPVYNSAVESFELGKAFGLAARTRNNIGNLFLSLNQPDIARPYIVRAVAECDDEVALAQFKATEARLLCAEGKYDEAEEVAAESAEFLRGMGEETFAAESLRTLGEIVLAKMRVGVR